MQTRIVFWSLLFILVAGCSGGQDKPLVWDIHKSFKKRGVVEYGKWGTALLQNPRAIGVRLFPGSSPEPGFDPSCSCNTWRMPDNLAGALGAVYKTSVSFLDTRYELVPSPGKSEAATPTLLLTVEREGDHGRLRLRAMLENQELGRFEARVNGRLLFDWKKESQQVSAREAPGTWDLWSAEVRGLFSSAPEESELFGPVHEFLVELGSPLREVRMASKGIRL